MEKNYLLLGSRSGACFHYLLKFYSHCIKNNKEFGGLIIDSKTDEYTYNGNKNQSEIYEIKNSICKVLGLPNVIDLNNINTKKEDYNIVSFKERPGFDEKYFDDEIIYKLRNNCKIYKQLPIDNILVSVHIRRGDVPPGYHRGAKRYLYNEYYINLINSIKEITNNNCTINIFSEKKSYESFDVFKDLNCNLFLDTNIGETYENLINSHIVIMSRSSFSYVPAIYNKNIVIYHPMWHKKLKNWLDVSEPGFNDSLKKLILNLYQ